MSEVLGRVEWSVATRPATGHTESGDFVCVRDVDDGVLVVVVDVLGHGSGAAEAARRFLEVIEGDPVGDLSALFARCDMMLRSDRGAVMTAVLLRNDEQLIRYLGVGNVQAVVVRSDNRAVREWLLIRSGVLGSGIPLLEARTLPVLPGDVLVLATDGVHAAYASAIDPLKTVDRIAQDVLDTHATGKDDALVLAARFAPATV
jgi:negative regulator of sigma-B (phosphoserine phosphatase)